jgi:chromosome partitioning protein
VLVDCPGAADVLLRAAMRGADLVLAPAQPSPPDVWATRATLKMAMREGALARVVLNRVSPRGGPLAEVERLLAEDGAELLTTRIGNRVAFANAFLDGRGVTESPRAGKAAEEIAALVDEVIALLG